MPDERRTDPSRGYAGNPAAYDQRESGGDQRASSKAHDFTRSRSPEERREQRDARDEARLRSIEKGADGITRKQNITGIDPLQTGARTLESLIPVVETLCVNGAAGTLVAACFSPPQPL